MIQTPAEFLLRLEDILQTRCLTGIRPQQLNEFIDARRKSATVVEGRVDVCIGFGSRS